MRNVTGLVVLSGAALVLGGCAIDEHEGGIAGILMDGPGDGGYYVHEHLHNLGLRTGPYDTLAEANEVAGEHNAVHHMGTRVAYVSERADGLGDWHRMAMGWETPWHVIGKPRELPN